MELVEAVPNISEGRDAGVLAEIAKAFSDGVERTPGTAGGAAVLDMHSDPDHHRAVLTLAGRRNPLIEGLIALAGAVIATVDISAHRGVHPRFGALDVVPFVPLSGAPMESAVVAAREFAERLWREEAVPVYFYGEIGKRSLPEVRAAIRSGAPPDLGRVMHPTAGVTVVGARGLLVAYNVELDSDDVDVAREIAAELRKLPGIRALSFYLASKARAQVSMNLTEPESTGVAEAYEAVRRAASRRGVGVLRGEVVGLAPRASLPPGSDLSCVLEERLAAAGLA